MKPPFLQYVWNPFEGVTQAWHCDVCEIWRLSHEEKRGEMVPARDFLDGMALLCGGAS